MDKAKNLKLCTDSLKKHLSLLVAFMLLFTAVSGSIAPVKAEAAIASGNYTYNNVSGGVEIAGYSGPGGRVVIPTHLDGKPVVGIGYRAFYKNKSITEVIVHGEVRYIGMEVFDLCSSLSFVYLAEGVKTIDTYAFGRTNNSFTINIPDSVGSLGYNAFFMIYNLTVYTPSGSYAQQWVGSNNTVAFDQKTHTHTGEKLSSADPTCTTDGYETLRCTDTGCRLDVTTTIPKLNHDFSELLLVTKASCTTDGEQQRACKRDGCYYVDKVSVSATGHQYGSWTVTNAASCTSAGERTRKCIVPNCGVIDSEELKAKGHNFSDWITKEASTCIKQGIVERKCITKNCTYTEAKALAYAAHTLSDWNATKESTCVKQGVSERKCTQNGCVYKENKALSNKTHTYETVTTKAALTKNGKVETKCSVCGYVSKTTTVYYPKTIKLSKTEYTYNGKVQTPSVTVEDSNGNTLKKDTDYTVKYESGRKLPGKYTVTITFKGKYSGTKKLTYTIAPRVTTKVTATSTTTTITLKWNKVTGAEGYRIYQYNTKTKKYEKVKDVTGTSLKISKLKAGTEYKFKVRAFTKDDGTIMGAYSPIFETATKAKTPTLKVTSTKKGTAALSWTNVTGESGYQVYYATKKNGEYKKVDSYKVNVVKGSKSKLTSGKTYYFKVRAYTKTDSGTVYSAWSTVKSVRVK